MFTCRTTDSTSLIWNSDRFSNELSFVSSDPHNTQRVDGSFTATLTEVENPNGDFIANFTSTLAVNATVDLSGTVIECTNQLVTQSQTLLVAGWHSIASHVRITVIKFTSLHTGMASPPLNPTSIIQTYHRHNFTVRVEWEDSTSGADTYMYTISSDTSPMETVPGNETSVVLTLSYNMVHTVTITTTLCNVTSEAATVDIIKGQVHAYMFIIQNFVGEVVVKCLPPSHTHTHTHARTHTCTHTHTHTSLQWLCSTLPLPSYPQRETRL